MCEAEERRAIREAEERKAVLAAEAKEAQRKRDMEAEEAQRKRDMEAEEAQRVREFELEKLRLENEAKRLAVERQVEERHIDRRPVGGRVKLPELPSFTDGKDDLDSYLLRFERYATVAEWNRDSWATHLSALLSGNALDVYSRLSQEEALCYDRLKTALLNRYNYTEHGYKQRFREAKPEGFETPGQFIVRLKNYLCKWIELSEVTKSFEGVVDLMVREQFGNACSKELSVYLTERKPKTIEELADIADRYLVAHNKKLSSRSAPSRKEDGRPKELGGAGDAALRCFSCQDYGHKAADCRVRATGSRRTWEANRGRKYCQRCRESGHDATDCRARLRGQGLQFPDGNARSKPPVHHVGCGIPVKNSAGIPEDRGHTEQQSKLENYPSSSDEKQWLELRDGSKVKILNAACLDKVDKNQMPVVTGLVGETPVEVLRDTGCSGVIVKKALVKEQQLTGAVGYIMTIDRRALKVPIAIIDIDTPYFAGKTEAMCMSDPIFELIVGNIPGARAANDENKEWCVPAAVVTRARAKQETRSRPLLVASSADELPVTKNQLMQLQEEDESLDKFKNSSEAVIRKGYEVSYRKKRGLWYRIRKRADSKDEKTNQILVPKKLRRKVMELAHDSMLGGHMGIKKTEDRILSNFFWPGMHQDVASYCRSCDICQRTVAKGGATRVPLGKMPLIDMPFKRVAIDLIGPITPASDKGHRYILTLVDYATRYPEAVPLKNIDTETVAEALLDLYSRIGVPEEVLSDLGTQFVSECMQEVSRLLSIRRLTTTPYHPICNGLTEKFNGTLKKMLRRLCADQPRQWYRFINPLLFAYREVPQESTGFAPFELMYGRTVRGPMKILKELWTNENEESEVKTSYQYVFELRERLEKTMRLAQEELRKSQGRYKQYYDRKAKERVFKEGDKVLVMLPTNNNKLLMQWQGPYKVVRKQGENDYIVDISNKTKLYHANMLKLYLDRTC